MTALSDDTHRPLAFMVLPQRCSDPHKESVKIDGQDISRIPPQSLRGTIAVVPRDILLFQRTIRSHIRYGHPGPRDEEVVRGAIARAVLKGAPIPLRDEATAALVSESEKASREALSRLRRGPRGIAIAHRLATRRNFDRVVLRQAGRIIGDGPPDRPMQGPGPHRELAREISRLATHAA